MGALEHDQDVLLSANCFPLALSAYSIWSRVWLPPSSTLNGGTLMGRHVFFESCIGSKHFSPCFLVRMLQGNSLDWKGLVYTLTPPRCDGVKKRWQLLTSYVKPECLHISEIGITHKQHQRLKGCIYSKKMATHASVASPPYHRSNALCFWLWEFSSEFMGCMSLCNSVHMFRAVSVTYSHIVTGFGASRFNYYELLSRQLFSVSTRLSPLQAALHTVEWLL